MPMDILELSYQQDELRLSYCKSYVSSGKQFYYRKKRITVCCREFHAGSAGNLRKKMERASEPIPDGNPLPPGRYPPERGRGSQRQNKSTLMKKTFF
jgi:hypothetical protein